MKAFRNMPPGMVHHQWLNELGPVIQYDANLSVRRPSMPWPRRVHPDLPLQIPRLITTDQAVLHHILVSDAYNFPKPGLLRRLLGNLVGEGTYFLGIKLFAVPEHRCDIGVLIAEGATHQRQRKIMASKLL